MEDEFLFEVLENAVGRAADDLILKGSFRPFAYALTVDNQSLSFNSDKFDDNEAYDALWADLKREVEDARFKAVILFQECAVPKAFNLPSAQSIRVHIESRNTLDDKIGARYLYIPYELYLEEGKPEVKLFQPKPIAMTHEIFTT